MEDKPPPGAPEFPQRLKKLPGNSVGFSSTQGHLLGGPHPHAIPSTQKGFYFFQGLHGGQRKEQLGHVTQGVL